MRRKKPFRTEIRDIEIYAIISPETNQVFIGKNRFPNHYQSYKDHTRLNKAPTKDLFLWASENQIFPLMYLLNRLETTETRAYRYIVAWTKFFLEKDFQVLSHQKTLDYASDLLEETQKIYDQIKDISLEEITSEERVLVSNYNQRIPPRTE